MAELRRVIEDLRPGPLDDLGLADALTGTARHLLDEAGIACETSVSLVPESGVALAAANEVVLYRIGVEAVTNVVHHAHAVHCRLELLCAADEVVLRIEDDGVSPSPASADGYYRAGGGSDARGSGPQGGFVTA